MSMQGKKRTLALSILLATAATGTALRADDVEVYVTPPSSPVPPNVLFVLDESGSMWCCGSNNRMNQLKNAMRTILSDPDNEDITAGILAYTTRTHPTRVVHDFALIADQKESMIDAVDSLTPLSGTPSIHALASAILWYERGFMGKESPIGDDPAGNWCKRNYVVFLSDGSPNSNFYEIDLAGTLRVTGSPDRYRETVCSTDSDTGEIYNPYDGEFWSFWTNGGHCAKEIGNWARNVDLKTGGEWDWDPEDTTRDPDKKRIQNIVIHTIGMDMADGSPPFDDRERFMKFVAREGGGSYFSASTAEELSNVFQKILNEAKASIPYTYTAPAVPFNQDNAAVSGNYIYVPLFEPGIHPLWYGNIKKYKLSFENSDPDDPSSIKKLVLRDKNNQTVLNSSYLFQNSTDLWNSTGSADGGEPLKGGAASNFSGTRLLYTWIEGNTLALFDEANRVTSDNDQLITKKLLGDLEGNSRLDDLGSDYDTRAVALLDWLTWKRELKLPDGKGGTVTVSHRGEMGAPLHTHPVVMRHNNKDYVFITTTEGLLHVLDGDTGRELWAFMPADLLPTVADSFVSDWNATKPHNDSNEPIPPDDHGHVLKPLYGLDGPLVKYTAANGRTYLVMGMRRGGRNYYALDITNPTEPVFAWKIEGGKGEFTDLGQTWSRPLYVKLQLDGSSTVTEALVFGGGYDTNQDHTYIDKNSNGKYDAGDTILNRSFDGMGNAIYIVNPVTGAYIRSFGENQAVKGALRNGIAADLLPVDINANGITDRFYAADVGGRLIRVDIPDQALKNLTGTGDPSVTVLADVNGESGEPATDFQRFFNTPEVAYFNKGGTQYLALMIASGHRPEPLSTTVTNDRFYMIKDPNVWTAPADNDNDSKPDYPDPITEADLYDATANLIQVGTSTQKAAASASLASKSGWYIDLGSGEKGFSRAKVYDYTVLFTTYSGERTGTGDPCEAQNTQGESRFYALDMTDGSAVFAEMDGNSGSLNTADRSKVLKIPGMPPAPSLITPSTVVDGKVRLGGVVVGLVGLEEVARWADRFHPISWEEVIDN